MSRKNHTTTAPTRRLPRYNGSALGVVIGTTMLAAAGALLVVVPLVALRRLLDEN